MNRINDTALENGYGLEDEMLMKVAGGFDDMDFDPGDFDDDDGPGGATGGW